MRNVVTLHLVAALAAVSAAPAMAQERQDPYAQALIAQGDYDTAERHLMAEARIYPNKPEVLLNLAAVMARTNRPDRAAQLYARVLAGKDMEMRLADDRVVMAHQIATTGMARLRTPVTATALDAR